MTRLGVRLRPIDVARMEAIQRHLSGTGWDEVSDAEVVRHTLHAMAQIAALGTGRALGTSEGNPVGPV